MQGGVVGCHHRVIIFTVVLFVEAVSNKTKNLPLHHVNSCVCVCVCVCLHTALEWVKPSPVYDDGQCISTSPPTIHKQSQNALDMSAAILCIWS